MKAETNLRAKSLKTYKERFEPELSIRTSMSDYKKEDWLLNLPLYAIENLAAEQPQNMISKTIRETVLAVFFLINGIFIVFPKCFCVNVFRWSWTLSDFF